MVNFSAWLSGATSPLIGTPTANEAARAAAAWRRIQDKPTVITLKPASGANRAAQTVRVESDDRSGTVESAAGSAPRRSLVVFGVQNHPLKATTVPDTVMAEGDRFVWNGDEYRCTDIVLTLGEIQGIFEANG